MSYQTFMSMEQADFYQLKLLKSESQEEFLKEYLKYDKKCTKDFYLKLLIELQKAILANNIENFLTLCNAVLYFSSAEKSENLKDYYDDVNNPFRSTNLVILSCKHDKMNILKHLFGSCSGILYNLSGRTNISPTDEDESGLNAFYYAIRSGNTELLNILSNWPGNYFSAHSEELDEILSRNFEELKLKNVLLSDQMEIYVESKLIDLRFFSNSSSQNQNIKHNHSNIKQRVELVLQQFNLLKKDYENREIINEKFLFIAKSIAQNIHVLKRKLRSTYDRLPWEEIEFCLVFFVFFHSKQQEMNLFYHALLDKSKILNHLENFVKQLSEIKNSIESVSISALAKLPNSKREKIIGDIMNNFPQFVELYKDYEQIRDIYSLQRINTCIKLALSVSPKEREGHLIITRVLQVIGKYLKNSLESPNLSTATADLLLYSLPRNTREIIIDLRNSLSHADSLSKRTEIEENTDADFFTGIQNDAKKVGDVIADILYKKTVKILKTLLNKIIKSKNFDEISNVIKVLKSAELEKQIQENFEILEFLKLEKIINEMNSYLLEKNLYENDLISKINTIIESAKSSSNNMRLDYEKGYAALQAFSYSSHEIDHNDIEIIKIRANTVLKHVLSEVKMSDFKEIAELSMKLFHSAKLRMQDDILDKMRRLVSEIVFIAEYEINDIKCIEELRKNLNDFNTKHQQKKINVTKEENGQLALKLSELKSFLSINSLSDQAVEKLSFYKNDKKLQAVVEMLVLDIMSILGCSQHYLENNVLYLDDNTPLLIGKFLRNYLAHDNILVDAFLIDPSMAIVLNAKKLTEENMIGGKKIGKVVIDNPFKVKEKFNQRLNIIINQEKMISAVENGNLKNLKSCLKKGADICARSLNSWTTLHFAAKGSNLEIVKFILNYNISANDKNVNSQNPLHIAAIYGRKNIVKYFIKDVGLCIDDVDKFGKTSLHYAAENGHKETVKVLLKYGAKIVIDKIMGVLPPLYYAIFNNHIDVCKIFLENCLDVVDDYLGGYTPLHAAAECGHLELLNILLEKGADVNARNDRNWTPLHAAVFYGHLDVVNALIYGKANVNARIVNGCTPLHYAVEGGHLEIAQVLLKHEADVNAIDKICSDTPLHYAAMDGHDKIVKILLEYEACANAENAGGRTPLHMATKGSHIEIVNILLNHDVNINAKDKVIDAVPLYYASHSGNQKIVEILIKHQAEINIKEKNGRTALHIAVLIGHKHIVDVLIKNKANVNTQDNKGFTTLHAAARTDNEDVINLLIKNGVKMNAKSVCGLTPLHIASLRGHKNIVSLLIKHNATVSARNSDGFTPLHMAVLEGHKNVVDLLIKSKADVNDKSIGGATALHIAVESGFQEIVETLIANGADVNLKCNSSTPLLSAVKYNNPKLVEILIKNGANASDKMDAALLSVSIGNKDILEILLNNKAQVNAKYVENSTLLHVAAERDHKEIVNILIKRGAKINSINSYKETPLYLAAKEGYEEIVKMCITHGASITVVNDAGFTPLHAAVAKGHVNIVKILLDKKMNIDVKDNQNRTLLELAVGFGHLQIVKMLVEYQNIDLNAKGNRGYTVLHIAAQESSLEMVKFLVDKGCNINARNAADSRPIHIAVREGFLDAVKFFLSVGSNVNDRGTDNQTLLHYAAMKNRVEVLKYLIAQGADVNAVDRNGCSPLFLAIFFGYKDIIEVLFKNGIIYEKPKNKLVLISPNKNVNTFLLSIERLYDAVKSDNPSEVEKIIKGGALVDVRYGNGLTSLHYATWKNYDTIVNILLQYKANPNVVDNQGYTPLHYAAKYTHLKIAKALLYNGAIYNAVSNSGKTPSSLTTDKNITSLLKLIAKSFQNVKDGNSNSEIVKNLNKIKDISTIKAIMGAQNEEHKTLIVVAMLNGFPQVEYLKQILQDNVSVDIKKAELLLEQGDFHKALVLFKTIFEKRNRLLGPDNPATLDIQTYIAKAFIKVGDYKKALNMYEEIFQKQKELLGYNYKDTLSTKSSVALVLHLLGRNEKALDIFQDVYQTQKDILGSNHDDTLETQFYMALVLDKLGKYEEALNINIEVFEKRKEKNPSDPAILQAESNIALVLANQGKCEEALEIYKNVFDKKEQQMGKNHFSTLKTLSNIAGVLANLKKYHESVSTFQEVLGIQKSVLGPNHPDTLYTKYNLANVLFLQAKWTNALLIFTEVLGESKLALGNHHPTVLDISKKLKMIDEIFKLEGRDASEVLQHLEKDGASHEYLNSTVKNLLNAEVDIKGDVLRHLKDIYIDPSRHDDLNTVKQLLSAGANVNTDTSEMLEKKKRDIYNAACNGDVRVVQQLLNAGVSVHEKDCDGRTALHYAVCGEQMDVMNVLLKYGADVTQVTHKGETPLHAAASKGNKEIIEVLLRHVSRDKLNDYINAKTTTTGATALHLVAKNGWIEIVKILLKQGARFNIENKECLTPLNLSSSQNVSELLLLIERLFDAARNRKDVIIIQVLMTMDTDMFFAVMNSRDKEGKTLLQVSLMNCHRMLSRILVDMLKKRS